MRRSDGLLSVYVTDVNGKLWESTQYCRMLYEQVQTAANATTWSDVSAGFMGGPFSPLDRSSRRENARSMSCIRA